MKPSAPHDGFQIFIDTRAGVGNGDPAWQEKERPDEPDARTFRVKTFNGLAQVLLQSTGAPGTAALTVSGPGIPSADLTVNFR